jgi:hypothetical protein
MYPGVIEQIEGVKRVLKDVIRPALDSRYAEDVLHWSVRVLNHISNEVAVAHPLNLREAAAIRRLLMELLPELRRHAQSGALTPEIIAKISLLAMDGPLDPTNIIAAESHLNTLRDLAAQVARALAFHAEAEPVTQAFLVYVRELSDMNALAFGPKLYA